MSIPMSENPHFNEQISEFTFEEIKKFDHVCAKRSYIVYRRFVLF